MSKVHGRFQTLTCSNMLNFNKPHIDTQIYWHATSISIPTGVNDETKWHFYIETILSPKLCSMNASAQAALQAAQALSGHTGDTQGGPSTVLRVVIEHMLYPITLDILYQIFSRFGKVLKIVTFTKNNSFQVLVQYQELVAAQAAKMN
uniref:RRM_8 domain-containing protein n=1 Tax=Rhodnius prolixus TaxID=13249 RepID=T1HJ76_RHOPR